MRRTKIVITLGPATDPPEILERVIAGGVDVVRLNAAHGDVGHLASRLDTVRAVSEKVGSDVAVLVDLAGPKLRVGPVIEGAMLEAGAPFALLAEDCTGDQTRACVTHAGLSSDVSEGDRILIDDGRIELRVESVSAGEVSTRVVAGGPLRSRKGVNVPGVTLSVDPLTPNDLEVLAWAMEAGVDWIGQSFVRSAQDIEMLRREMTVRTIPVVAKIEKHEAVTDMDAIIAAADAVMVARGDLAVETSPELVPVLQRRVLAAARARRRPAIVATEMLDSMRERPTPTRAEASDVANAIFSSADAVMLSAETAVGAYPVQAVETMVRIIDAAEKVDSAPREHVPAHGRDDIQDAVSSAVCEMASDLGLAAIVPVTQSGATAFAVSRFRPQTPIFAATPHARTARRLALCWGVRTVVLDFAEDIAVLLDDVTGAMRDSGHVASGDRLALTAGLSARAPGGTDFIHVRTA